MANHKSAIKRHRQSLRRRETNRVTRSAVRDAIKKSRIASASGDAATATAALRAAEKAIATAAGKHTYHHRNAARKISRLAKLARKATTKKA